MTNAYDPEQSTIALLRYKAQWLTDQINASRDNAQHHLNLANDYTLKTEAFKAELHDLHRVIALLEPPPKTGG